MEILDLLSKGFLKKAILKSIEMSGELSLEENVLRKFLNEYNIIYHQSKLGSLLYSDFLTLRNVIITNFIEYISGGKRYNLSLKRNREEDLITFEKELLLNQEIREKIPERIQRRSFSIVRKPITIFVNWLFDEIKERKELMSGRGIAEKPYFNYEIEAMILEKMALRFDEYLITNNKNSFFSSFIPLPKSYNWHFSELEKVSMLYENLSWEISLGENVLEYVEENLKKHYSDEILSLAENWKADRRAKRLGISFHLLEKLEVIKMYLSVKRYIENDMVKIIHS